MNSMGKYIGDPRPRMLKKLKEDNMTDKARIYTCYRETQTEKFRCPKHCGNTNYCPRKVVCKQFEANPRNSAICITCMHTEKTHLELTGSAGQNNEV